MQRPVASVALGVILSLFLLTPLRAANALGFRKPELSMAQPVVSQAAAFRSDDLLGSEVRIPGNVALGSVDDVVVRSESGGIAYLVVAPGGVFGLVERHVAVPWDRFKISPNLNILGLESAKDSVDRASRIVEGRFVKAAAFAPLREKAGA